VGWEARAQCKGFLVGTYNGAARPAPGRQAAAKLMKTLVIRRKQQGPRRCNVGLPASRPAAPPCCALRVGRRSAVVMCRGVSIGQSAPEVQVSIQGSLAGLPPLQPLPPAPPPPCPAPPGRCASPSASWRCCCCCHPPRHGQMVGLELSSYHDSPPGVLLTVVYSSGSGAACSGSRSWAARALALHRQPCDTVDAVDGNQLSLPLHRCASLTHFHLSGQPLPGQCLCPE
jgi:hypothetical protein